MPQISIVIPVYKAEKYLCACLDSVLNQSFTDFKVICVDDGSTDKSGEILDIYAQKDPRITVIHQENKGLSMARNAGIKRVATPYVVFLDSDDFVHPDFLMCLYQAIYQTQSDIAWCDYVVVRESACLTDDMKKPIECSNPMVYENIFDNFILKKIKPGIIVWNKILRTDFVKELMFETIKPNEDGLFCNQYFYKAQKGAYVPYVMNFYRDVPTSITSNKFSKDYIENSIYSLRLLRDKFNDKKMPADIRKKFSSQISIYCLKMCLHFPCLCKKIPVISLWEELRPVLIQSIKDSVCIPCEISVKYKILLWLFVHKQFFILKLILKR